MMQKLMLIGLAGAFGALARYGLGGLVQRFTGVTFPWGTFVVNILGAFLFGLIWSLVEQRLVISVETRVIILSGFLGAFTTFSSFMFETSSLIGEAQWGLAVLNVGGQIVLGLAAMFLGLATGRVF
jgi:CrcB protein